MNDFATTIQCKKDIFLLANDILRYLDSIDRHIEMSAQDRYQHCKSEIYSDITRRSCQIIATANGIKDIAALINDDITKFFEEDHDD